METSFAMCCGSEAGHIEHIFHWSSVCTVYSAQSCSFSRILDSLYGAFWRSWGHVAKK